MLANIIIIQLANKSFQLKKSVRVSSRWTAAQYIGTGPTDVSSCYRPSFNNQNTTVREDRLVERFCHDVRHFSQMLLLVAGRCRRRRWTTNVTTAVKITFFT